ncbi:hypothetical protein PHLGIDRAFT_211328 [Phlebiopsis gigantea 11061_1 CR5-6]|uniref:Uncharacterized protein n=1 Tax=Phlebiopsis gigantea (strain 11061_1 CR5-6) TaxID=745531 RepID=A0A0C3NH21_PHLG1|nr:hypothetical protein PHLGIDRAFT_211328 [Phlebiopsis gigantea 11061_1 CR5-6]
MPRRHGMAHAGARTRMAHATRRTGADVSGWRRTHPRRGGGIAGRRGARGAASVSGRHTAREKGGLSAGIIFVGRVSGTPAVLSHAETRKHAPGHSADTGLGTQGLYLAACACTADGGAAWCTSDVHRWLTQRGRTQRRCRRSRQVKARAGVGEAPLGVFQMIE